MQKKKLRKKKNIIMRTTKDGKTMMIFSSDQKNMAKAMRDKIRKKLDKTKINQLCDFKVIK